MGVNMKLKRPPEPKALKNQIINSKKSFEIKIESIAIWLGNKLPRYLWKEAGWGKDLKKEGYSWQSFLKILSLHKKDMIKWSWNSLSWKDFLNRVEETIKDPVLKKIVLSKKTS